MEYKIVIDPGHGGSDSGAIGNDITEKDLNLEISKYMYDRLKQLGYDVYITRDTDETISPNDRVRRILNAYGNNSDVIVISNHINAGGGDGAEVIYALRNNSNLSNLILDNLKDAGQNIRKAYQRRLPSDTSKDYYFIHRDTGVTEPVIVEYGFLDSSLDDVNQLKQNYEKYAEAVVKAIVEYTRGEELSQNQYIVKKGDSLYSIARTYNTTVENLKTLNNLTSNNLSIGQVLKLPTADEDYITYIVVPGDTLYNIALKYGLTIQELKEINNLSTNILSVGQILKIPKQIENDNIYIVKSGDSLYSIAKKYNTNVNTLKEINNLTSNVLSINQKLKLPTSNEYTVKKGDTLYSIARTYNTTVDNLKTLNNLTTNTLSVGQKIKVP